MNTFLDFVTIVLLILNAYVILDDEVPGNKTGNWFAFAALLILLAL